MSPPADNLPVKIRPPGKLSVGSTLRGGDPIMGSLFHETGDILIRKSHQFRDYLSLDGFITGEAF